MKQSTKIAVATILTAATVAAGLVLSATAANVRPPGSVDLWAHGFQSSGGTHDVWGIHTPAPAAPVAAPAPIDGDTDGNGKLSEFEKQVLAKRNYVLVDGTTVPAPKPGEAVPAAIVEDIKARAAGNVDGMSYGNRDAMLSHIDFVKAEQKRLGRTIISVNLGQDGNCMCPKWVAWTMTGAFSAEPGLKDSVLAEANALAARVPGKYAVIVFD